MNMTFIKLEKIIIKEQKSLPYNLHPHFVNNYLIILI